MPRPFKQRRIRGKINSNYFKPAGIPIKELEENILSIDEFESLRLIHDKNLDQEEASKKMEISQPTFSRILKSATRKISDAIINAKAIKIEKI